MEESWSQFFGHQGHPNARTDVSHPINSTSRPSQCWHETIHENVGDSEWNCTAGEGSAASRSATLDPQRPQVRVCLCRQQHSLLLGPSSSNSVWAVPPIHRRRRHQLSQQLGAFRRPVFRKSRGLAIVKPPHIAPFSPSLPATAATPGFDALSLSRSTCGQHTLPSIQSCCTTPGNQETIYKVAHRITGAASLLPSPNRRARRHVSPCPHDLLLGR